MFRTIFPSPKSRRSLRSFRKLGVDGFSLVEVALAIGIVGFALLAVVGLLPTGLNSVQNAQEESFEMQSLSAISTSIQAATKATQGSEVVYTALQPFNGSGDIPAITWRVHIPGTAADALKPAQVDPVKCQFYLDQSGVPTKDAAQSRALAFVSISPPASPFVPGTAYICVAWTGTTTKGDWKSIPVSSSNTDQAVKDLVTLKQQKGYVEKTIYLNAQ